jgi:AraC-like DNA-binding protein
MKVLPFKIPKPGQDALIYQEDREWIFYDQLHQHQEIQLSYIANGTGTLVIGDSVCAYGPGDFFVIGSNIPHVFKSDVPAKEASFMRSLFFDRYSFGDDFFDMEETKELEGFFKRSRLGMRARSEETAIRQLMEALSAATKLERLVTLLQILQILSKIDYEVLVSGYRDIQLSSKEGQRLRDVFEYTMKHYQSEISLATIANVANLSKTAFCKYFKKRTNKTYNNFLNAYRVEKAVKELRAQPNRPIAEVAYDCGFGSISNFNKTFKKIKGHTPSQIVSSSD